MMGLKKLIKEFDTKNIDGVTFIELLVTIAIAAIILAAAIPSFNRMMNISRLESSAEKYSSYIVWGKSKANTGDNVHLVVSSGSNWCYGLNSTASCNCNVAGSCSYLNISSSDYPNISLNNISGISSLQLSNNSGQTSEILQLSFSDNYGNSIITTKNQIDIVESCSNQLPNYTGC